MASSHATPRWRRFLRSAPESTRRSSPTFPRPTRTPAMTSWSCRRTAAPLSWTPSSAPRPAPVSLDALLADAARGRMIREGLTVAIVGRPNAGKSSLFNRLAGAARAIVTDVPGTTRDLLTERVDVGGVPLTIVDTAGLREGAGDAIEEEGISRARRAGEAADLVLVVLDRSRALTDDDEAVLAHTASR